MGQDRAVLIDTLLMARPDQVRARAEALAATGHDGLFTFEGPHDVFLPLTLAAETGLFLYSNIAVAFPRSPMHLAHTAWDLQALAPGGFALGLGTDDGARWLVGFYGSTPAYEPVLGTEGRAALHPQLRRLSREGHWDEMAALVDDDLLDGVVVRGDPDQVARRLHGRFAGRVDRLAIYAPGGITDAALTAVVSSLRTLGD